MTLVLFAKLSAHSIVCTQPLLPLFTMNVNKSSILEWIEDFWKFFENIKKFLNYIKIAEIKWIKKKIQNWKFFVNLRFSYKIRKKSCFYLLLAAASRSFTSLIIRLICVLVFSNSFSCLLRFSRKSGLSSRQSVNSSACKPAVTILDTDSRIRKTFI